MRASLVSGLVAALALSVNAIPTISTKGRYFFTSNGNRWFIKGVAYQLYSTGTDIQVDPFVNVTQCTADAQLMASIGVNAVRTYHVRPALDHTACMNVFANLGIYVFVDLDDYPSQLDQTAPGWTNQQKAYFEAVMDEFAQFDNTAGFYIGNEVITSGADSGVAPYLRAAVRDMKAYRASKGYRAIPIGYSHADVQSIGYNLENYWACTSAVEDSSSELEFYSLNSYRWCGSNTFQGSGYVDILNATANYPIPIFMSETGCNQPEPRLFQDQTALLGPDMNEVWSGAIIYEWLQEDNHYGLVTYGGGSADALVYTPPSGTWPRGGVPTPVQPDFNNLKSVWATLTPTGVNLAVYTPTLSALSCPAYQAGSWQVDANQPLPTATGAVSIPVSKAYNLGGAAAVAVSTPVPAVVASSTIVVVTSTQAAAATTSVPAAAASSSAAAVSSYAAAASSSASHSSASASSASSASAAAASSSASHASSPATSVISSVAAAATSVVKAGAASRPTGVVVGVALALAGVVGIVA